MSFNIGDTVAVLDDVIKCDCELERHERAKMELDYNKCMDCKKEIEQFFIMLNVIAVFAGGMLHYVDCTLSIGLRYSKSDRK